jgi:hypothetical protein
MWPFAILCLAEQLEGEGKTIFRNVGSSSSTSIAFQATGIFTFDIFCQFLRVAGQMVTVSFRVSLCDVRGVRLMNCLMHLSFKCKRILMQVALHLVLPLTTDVCHPCDNVNWTNIHPVEIHVQLWTAHVCGLDFHRRPSGDQFTVNLCPFNRGNWWSTVIFK